MLLIIEMSLVWWHKILFRGLIDNMYMKNFNFLSNIFDEIDFFLHLWSPKVTDDLFCSSTSLAYFMWALGATISHKHVDITDLAFLVFCYYLKYYEVKIWNRQWKGEILS